VKTCAGLFVESSEFMHLPDAFLDAKTTALAAGLAAVGVGVALRQVKASVEPRQVPLLGLAGAFIFAAQMVNFPVFGGTSGHVLGGVLAAILLGPAAAVLVLTCVLLVQCLMFADGGLLALGANVFNMSVVSVCGGYAAFRAVRSLDWGVPNRSMVLAAAFAGWVGTVLASIACAGELAFAGTSPWNITFPAMLNIHMLIGLGEGAITGLVVLGVLRVRPELLAETRRTGTSSKPTSSLWLGLPACLGLALFVAPFACPWPDGLERVAEQLGFAVQTRNLPETGLRVLMPNYQLPLVNSPTLATALAGACGTILAFGAAYVFARSVVPSASRTEKG
jgi:cobalt/nickel transport system permease protein